MRPPQESAASSGWGATNTWVIAGEDSIGARRPGRSRRTSEPSAPPASTPTLRSVAEAAYQGHEDAGVGLAPVEAVTPASDHQEVLQIA